MLESERWAYVPFPPDDRGPHVDEVEERLKQLVGGDWQGYHYGVSVPGAAMWVRFGPGKAGREVVTGVMLLGDAITKDQLRAVPLAAAENSRNLSVDDAFAKVHEITDALPPLVREPGVAPEEFSALVAKHYEAWARYVPHPAGALAVEWNVKPPTMHSWIREARLRGLLPAARRGKAGS
jgi:hypothetical protein